MSVFQTYTVRQAMLGYLQQYLTASLKYIARNCHLKHCHCFTYECYPLGPEAKPDLPDLPDLRVFYI